MLTCNPYLNPAYAQAQPSLRSMFLQKKDTSETDPGSTCLALHAQIPTSAAALRSEAAAGNIEIKAHFHYTTPTILTLSFKLILLTHHQTNSSKKILNRLTGDPFWISWEPALVWLVHACSPRSLAPFKENCCLTLSTTNDLYKTVGRSSTCACWCCAARIPGQYTLAMGHGHNKKPSRLGQALVYFKLRCVSLNATQMLVILYIGSHDCACGRVLYYLQPK